MVALKLVAAGRPLVSTGDVVAAPTFPGAEDDPLQAELARWLTLTVATDGGELVERARARGAPILVVAGEAQALPLPVGAYLVVAAPTAAYVLGGPLVVADALETDLETDLEERT